MLVNLSRGARISRLRRAAFLAVLGCASAAATAQQSSNGAPTGATAAAAVAPSPDQLAEVVVTAEKRVSTVQATPISITAITGVDLSARGITTVEEVAQETPGMSFRTAGPAQTEYEMRGVSSTGGSVGTVGFYFDETPITPPSFGGIGKVVIDPQLFDMQSIEVLRGPQGTLYGAGSMGGTIKLRTNQPVLNEFDTAIEAVGSGTDGGGFNRSGNLMLNIPIAQDSVALRLVASSDYRDGWLDRIVVNPFPFPSNVGCTQTVFAGCVRGDVAAGPFSAVFKRVNWERLDTVRPSLLLAPSDRLTISVSALYQHTTAGGYDNIDIPPGCGPGILCGHYQPADVPEPLSDTVKLLSTVVHYDASFAQITSATSYWTRSEEQTQDTSEIFQSIFHAPQFVAIPYTETDQSEQFSEELRATSNGNGPFQWLGGLFYSSFQYHFITYGASQYYAEPVVNPQGLLFVADFPYDTKEYAAFAEASYKLAPDWKLTAGLRAFRYQSEVDGDEEGALTPLGTAAPFPEIVSTSDHGLTPKFNLSYIPDDNLTVYATAAKGFRPGGISQVIPLTGPAGCGPSLQAIGLSAASITYGPDSLWNFEIGEKARLFDGRVTVHGDVFYIRWSGIQQVIPLSCGYLLEANAGDARSYGPELEVSANIAPGLTFNINGAYTNAEINHPAPYAGVAPGQPLLNIPKYTASTSLAYERPVFNDFTLFARASETIVGPLWDIAYTVEQLPSYALTDLRVGLSRHQWAATLFVNNLTNKLAIQTIDNTDFTSNIPDVTRATVNQPRTVGLKLDYHLRGM
jgi:outer membrane receptor protein involved in Fe transport